MKAKLIAVRTADFDIKMLRKAAREGRLFVMDQGRGTEDQGQGTEDLRRGTKDEGLLTLDHRLLTLDPERHRALWNAILTHPKLKPLLVFRQRADAGKPNKYVLTYILNYLYNQGIYDQSMTFRDLFLALEPDPKAYKYYRGCMRYAFMGEEYQILRSLVRDFQR